jgi:hypothetical protein
MVFEVMLGVGWFDERQLHLTLFDGCADADNIWQVVGLAGPIIGLNRKGQNRAPAVPPEDYLSFMYFTFLFFGETEPARASLAAGAAALKSAEKEPVLKRIR